MAAPPAPRALLALALVLALALLLGLGAAFATASLRAPTRPSVPAAGSSSSSSSSASRGMPRPGAAARLLHRAPVDVLDFPDAPVRRHMDVVALAVAPARRRLLAFPVDSLRAHGHGADELGAAAAPAAPPAGADDDDDAAGRVSSLPPRAPSTFFSRAGAGAAEGPNNGEPGQINAEDNSVVEHRCEPLSATLPASSVRRHVLALPAESARPHLPRHQADDPVASPAEAAPPSTDADSGREVPLPPRQTTCTFVTYIGGAGNATAESIQRGAGRVLVVQEFTGAGNGSEATAAPDPIGNDLASSSDDEDDEEEATDEEEGSFDKYMADFCKIVEIISDAFDVYKAST